MIREAPRGWVKTTLGEITEPSRGRALPAEVAVTQYVGLEHIEPQTMRLLGYGKTHDVRSSSVRFSKGDVLYGKMRPYLNKVWVAEFDGLCSAEFLVFPKSDEINNHFLAFRLNAEDFVKFANRHVSGERPRVDFGKLSRFILFLPPIDEQHRIVTKLSATLSRIGRAEMAMRRAHERLQRYVPAVLQAGVTGELTHDWRKAQRKKENVVFETGDALLRRILAVRRSRWEEVEFARISQKGMKPSEDWRSRYREPAEPDAVNLPELPEEWAWASLDMIAEIGSGISVSQNRAVKDPVELPYLRVANVMRGYLDLGEVKTIWIEKDRVGDYLLEKEDILFNEGGDRDKLGRGWIWEEQIPQCVHQNHVFRARLVDRSTLSAKLISHWGNTFGQKFFLAHGTQTTNLASINRSVLSKLPIPIPPFAEQKQIIREIENRLTTADRLAVTLKHQLKRVCSVRASLLREAFSGQLVSQDTDGDAASLLERIRLAREIEARRPKVKKMPKAKIKPKTAGRRTLLAVLKDNGGFMTPEELFQASGHSQESVDQFFAELRELAAVPSKIVEERKAKGLVLLKAVL